MDFIIIHGAPGNGKTTIASMLHERLGAPWFEFGWIPEFTKLNPHTHITQAGEEQLSFENIVLVARNYRKHGYENVLLSDLNDARMLDIPIVFGDASYVIITLYSENGDVLRDRIMTRDNGNEYRNFEEALAINRMITERRLLPNEYRIRSDNQSPAQITERIQAIIASHTHNPDFNAEAYRREDFFSYIKGYSFEE